MNLLYCCLFIYIITLFFVTTAGLFHNVYPRMTLECKLTSDAGDPLILTPFLKNGSIAVAQDLSSVNLTENMGVRSHAGFFTINEKYDSNLYFWYFPPFSKNEKAPVLLWLQGGPGASSLFGLFAEVGPLIVKNNKLKLRKYHWALNYHLIFIDNPVGSGFSFTKNDLGYCTDENCVAEGLYSAMQQFFTLFPNLRYNDFFLTGESYAGKYIPSFAWEIHEQNLNGKERINLMGMAIGNGYCDPINQLSYGTYLYQHGLLDNNQMNIFHKFEEKSKDLIKNESWIQAALVMDQLMDGDISSISIFKSFTGFNSYYNLLYTNEEYNPIYLANLLQNDTVRHSVHIGNLPMNDPKQVALYLAQDMMKSVAPIVSKLLSHYRIVFYNGQLDVIVAYPLTETFLRKLEFSASEEYKTAIRMIWKVGEDVAGYVKKAGNLTEILVRNAGHMVPLDQPKWAFDLITRVVNDGF